MVDLFAAEHSEGTVRGALLDAHRAAEGGRMTNWILFLLIVFVGILYRKMDVLEAKVYCIQHGIVPKEDA